MLGGLEVNSPGGQIVPSEELIRRSANETKPHVQLQYSLVSWSQLVYPLLFVQAA